MKRKIYDDLVKWKNNKAHSPFLMLGVRQCGKTYIIEKFIEENYAHYQTINLANDDRLINLYNTETSADTKYTTLKSMLDFDLEDSNSVLFVDEVQLSEGFISNLKYMKEEHPNVNIICAGSLLGVKLKKFKKLYPVGKVEYMYMYPMNFEEFLMASHKEKYIELIKDSYKSNKKLFDGIHNELIDLYKTFLITGGMPEAVKQVVNNKDVYMPNVRKIINDIIESYLDDMKKYVDGPNETLKIRNLYSSIPNQLGNTSHKFQITKLGKNSRNREFETSLVWLLASNMVVNCFAVRKPDISLKMYRELDVYKLYLSDVGILTAMMDIEPSDILLGKINEYKGLIAENYVANELTKSGFKLYYWSTPEVDFVERIGDDIVPIEVKAASNTQSKALKTYMEKFNPKYAIRVSTKNFGYNKDTKIKSVPLYAVFCIKK